MGRGVKIFARVKRRGTCSESYGMLPRMCTWQDSETFSNSLIKKNIPSIFLNFHAPAGVLIVERKKEGLGVKKLKKKRSEGQGIKPVESVHDSFKFFNLKIQTSESFTGERSFSSECYLSNQQETKLKRLRTSRHRFQVTAVLLGKGI